MSECRHGEASFPHWEAVRYDDYGESALRQTEVKHIICDRKRPRVRRRSAPDDGLTIKPAAETSAAILSHEAGRRERAISSIWRFESLQRGVALRARKVVPEFVHSHTGVVAEGTKTRICRNALLTRCTIFMPLSGFATSAWIERRIMPKSAPCGAGMSGEAPTWSAPWPAMTSPLRPK